MFRFFRPVFVSIFSLSFATVLWAQAQSDLRETPNSFLRERISLNDGWRFMKYASLEAADNLIYDVRPEVTDGEDGKAADAKPTEAVEINAEIPVLKKWILPTANKFIKNPAERFERPAGSPGSGFAFVQSDFDDSSWEAVTLPHDWAIGGPFMEGEDSPVGGGMGRLPSPGVAWYRKSLEIPAKDVQKRVYLDIDGAMSYAMVWLNGELVGGWPYGYASWRLDLTPYLNFGGQNQLAIRIDNPPHSSRWYPGGGLYRSVWLTKTHPVHVAQWGGFVTTSEVSKSSATIKLQIDIDNDSDRSARVKAISETYLLDENGNQVGESVATFKPFSTRVSAESRKTIERIVTLKNPKLWGPYATQASHRYIVITRLEQDGKAIDRYETRFGIRSLRFDARDGVFVNGERVYLQGVNQHHDLGALGAAFNVRAAERQLEILKEMGCNAIRLAHNPPDPGLLELTDRMGFLVIDEIFDVWERKKTPLDFHLIFPEWSEPDMRAFVRRDRNHPSVIMWSIGNEVGEQYTEEAGAAVAQRLQDILKEEDFTRPTSASMNFAKPHMHLPPIADSISLNYQGEGIRNAPEYLHLQGIRTAPLYPDFHKKFPDKIILSSENAAALSSRGEYLFPVSKGISAPISDGIGGNPMTKHVSSYELYTANFGSSADKVLGSLERHPFVAGGFIWSGWDYLGEPTPYYLARSSYFGVIDLAGFKKDRFYLYQAHWRPDYPMVHLLPHWNWPDRVGKVTPVHVFTSGDEVELFLNGVSQGRKKKGEYEYRLRWDDILYEPGEVKAVAYKEGKEWATKVVRTTGKPTGVSIQADRPVIRADGVDLAFVTAKILDKDGYPVANANTLLSFSIEGPGEIVATDNGDPTSLVSFLSHERSAFNGLCLVVVRGKPKEVGTIKLSVSGKGISSSIELIESR